MEQRIAEIEAQAEAIRAEIAALESMDEWTAADEAQAERLSDQAWSLEDQAAVLRAEVALQDALFAALVEATLDQMPAGPTNLGDPGVWFNGAEYWAYEVVELAESQAAIAA